MTTPAPTTPAATTPAATERIPLNTFAIGFGLAGLAEVWSVLGAALGWPVGFGQILWVVAAVAWVWLLVAHLVRGVRTRRPLAAQLRHPAQGPIAALAPTTGMLVGADLHQFVPVAGTILVLAAIVVALVFAGWLIMTWFEGRLELAAVHGGYLLPTVAAGFVGGASAAHIGLPAIGWGMFGIAIFFWVVITTLLILRLATAPPLPDPLVPTMAILLAPPTAGAVAWFSLDGARDGPVAQAIAGMAVLTLLIQIALVPRYRRLHFSLGFWSFTFPAAALVLDVVLWSSILDFPGCRVLDLVLAAAVTVFIGAIAVASLRLARRSRAAAERVLNRADDADAGRDPTQ